VRRLVTLRLRLGGHYDASKYVTAHDLRKQHAEGTQYFPMSYALSAILWYSVVHVWLVPFHVAFLNPLAPPSSPLLVYRSMLFLASNAGSQGDFYNLLPADLLLYNVPVLLFLMSIMVVKSQFSKYALLGFARVSCSASAAAYLSPRPPPLPPFPLLPVGSKWSKIPSQNRWTREITRATTGGCFQRSRSSPTTARPSNPGSAGGRPE
jgi:hypothetical protein